MRGFVDGVIRQESSSADEGIAVRNEEEEQVQKKLFAVLVYQRSTVVQSCYEIYIKNEY